MAEHQVLFCPFCRESFEGCTTCPEHELALVPFEKLPPGFGEDDGDDDEAEGSSESAVFGPFDPSHGRGVVALGALLVGLSLVLRFARFEGAESLRTYELARALPSLWTPGLVSFTVFYVLARRRTLHALRGLRVLVPSLSTIPVLTIAWARYGSVGLEATLGPAVYVVLLGSALLFYGGLRLGDP